MGFNVITYFDELKKSGESLLYYKGMITEDTSTDLVEELENQMHIAGVKKKIIKRVLYIFIEMIQNLYHHGYKKEVEDYPSNFGIIQVKWIGDEMVLYSANIVTCKVKRILSKRIEQLNVLTKQQLEDLYKEILANGTMSSKGGGGLGMINIIRKINNKIEYSFKPLNNEENLYFYIFKARLSF